MFMHLLYNGNSQLSSRSNYFFAISVSVLWSDSGSFHIGESA